jgi:hypothetical protein
MLALTSPTSGGRYVGTVRLRTTATEFSFFSLISENTLVTFSKYSLLRTICPPEAGNICFEIHYSYRSININNTNETDWHSNNMTDS